MRKVLVIALIVLAFCAALAVVGRRIRGRHMRGARAVRVVLGAALLAAYAYGILSQTILGRTAGARTANLELLWSYRAALALTEDGIAVTSAYLLAEILLNVLLFVPMGALLPFLAPGRFGSGRLARGMALVAAVALACSCAIELCQWGFGLGCICQ